MRLSIWEKLKMKRYKNNNNKSKLVLLFLGCTHLVLVTLSALYVTIPSDFFAAKPINFYLKASGADSSYGFFAPSIGSKARGMFEIVQPDGKSVPLISLLEEGGREAEIRIGGIYEEFLSDDFTERGFRKPLSASLAASIFTRYQNAQEVIFHLQEYEPTTMADFRRGQRSQWADFYVARFKRTDDR